MNSVVQQYQLPSISSEMHTPAGRIEMKGDSACFKKAIILQKLEG